MTLQALLNCRGRWQGNHRLYDARVDAALGGIEDTPSQLRIEPLLQDYFVRVDYDWQLDGAEQQGSLLFGLRDDAAGLTCHWIDSWHLQRTVLRMAGVADEIDGGSVEVRGSYAAPPGVDRAWRITLSCEADALLLAMVDIAPDGTEEIKVEAMYSRS